MSELVANCPRCGAKLMTFDLLGEVITHSKHNWQLWVEAFCVCRGCSKPTIFVLAQKEVSDKGAIINGLKNYNKAVNKVMRVESFISTKDIASKKPPEFIPQNIDAVFKEGTACMSIECFNAAGTMFRLCIDIVTRDMLPEDGTKGLNSATRRNLGLRLPWLFENGKLPETLRELSSCVKDDGNDGAHEGTLKKEDAENLLDFTYVILERIYTEPQKLQLAKERREGRRN